MNTKKMSINLLIGWFAIYVIAGVIALLFEYGPLKGVSLTDVKTIYILEVIGVLLSLALIPLALRGFKKMVDRLDEKEYPDLPKHLRDKLTNKINKYYQKLKNDSAKKNYIKEDNKQYQQIFYNFMLELLEDYPKYLKLDYGVRKTIKMHIKYLIDIEGYVKSRDPSERNFYQKILNTQMFIEFIYKRMMPKNSGEKIKNIC